MSFPISWERKTNYSMKKVLIIEDNKDVRENTADILELSNYKVSTAKNGKTGLILAKQLLPDVIVCDIMMPELDGWCFRGIV
jgi:CheY-like chemotaxis protein